jgi:vacuolar-type H+-ATPase subunit E/Vma4
MPYGSEPDAAGGQMNGNCGTSSAPRTLARGRLATLGLFAVAALALLLASAGVAAASSGTAHRPKPEKLWQSYPLDSAHKRSTGASGKARSNTGRVSPAAAADGSSGSSLWLVVALGVAGAVAIGGLAALAARSRRVTPAALGAEGGSLRVPSLSFRTGKGEPVMGNQKRKLWGRDDHHSSVEQPQPSDGEPPMPTEESLTDDTASSLKQRIDEYDPAAPQAEVAHHDAKPDLDDVGAEVGTVLKSAQEAATRMRGQARDEATRIREEAKAAAAAELDEARRLRQEAEAEAERIRVEAAAHAEQLKTDAEYEAEQTREEARLRFEQADQEVEERLRKAEGDARRRRDELETESQRYHERLEKMLGVFHGMSSQLEDLLSPQGEGAESATQPTLEDALQPTSGSERAA